MRFHPNPRRRVRALVPLAAIAALALAGSAQATTATTSGSLPVAVPVGVLGDLTLHLGPTTVSTFGVKNVKVNISWKANALEVETYNGHDCAIDTGIGLSPFANATVTVAYSVIKDNPWPQADQYVSATKTLTPLQLNGSEQEIGVCYDDLP